jgi:hypothetical protein
MAHSRWVTAADWANSAEHATRAANAASSVSGGSGAARLDGNYGTSGAAMNSAMNHANTLANQAHTTMMIQDGRNEQQRAHEQALQSGALQHKFYETAAKYGAQNEMSRSIGNMGGGLLSGLNAPAGGGGPDVGIYDNGGQQVGGATYRSPLSRL